MKEILKKDFLIEMELEVDEMAYKPKGTQDTSGKISKYKPIFKDENNTEIPDGWILNPTQTPGEETAVTFLHGSELDAFIQENKEFLDNLASTTGKDVNIVDGMRTKYHPRNVKTGTQYVASGEKMPAPTKIKRELNSLVNEYLGGEEISARLEKLSIPEIRARDRKHLDRYGVVNNDRVEYQTHTFNSYDTSQQFLQYVTARITGKEVSDDFKSYHLARQFNKNYQRWEETRKNDQAYQGKTPAYMLDRFGFDEDNLDVTVRMDLRINGIKTGDEFIWSISFKTKFGRKLKEERWIRNGLSLDKDVSIRKVVTIDQHKPFDDENTIMDDLSIKTGLIELLDELKTKIMTEFKPVEALKLANIKQYDITKKLNEDVVDSLVNSIIKEIKK